MTDPGPGPAAGPVVETWPVMAAGGDGLARLADGRVVLVEGGVPDERVEVVVTDERRDHARARVRRVVAAGPLRVAPACPHVAEGCGGCGWAQVAEEGQLAALEGIVADALRRIGHLDPPFPEPGARLAAAGHRTTVTLGVGLDGALGYRRRHAPSLVPVGDCRIAHPRVDELIPLLRAPGWTAVTLRAGLAGGERLAVLRAAGSPSGRRQRARTTPGGRAGRAGRAGRGGRSGRVGPDGGPVAGGGIVAPADVVAPSDVVVVRPGGDATLTEEVGGRRWRVSARSFFQAGPAGAELLAAAVDDAVGDAVGASGHLVDAYAGVGLLGGIVAARRGCRLTSVESDRPAVADARHNLADLGATVLDAEVGGSALRPADVVIADPARPGLGRPGVGAVTATGATRVVLVSCDAASLGRDAALLAAAGYRLRGYRVLGLFPDTAHVEVVSRFDR